MIVKKIKIQKMTKTKARQIADLVDYIRHPRDTNPEEKIEHSGGLNFLSEAHTGQRAEMISLAEESVHSKMPVSHWIFSWKEHEQPRKEQVDEVVDIFLRHMGLEGHQVIYALHYNTANYHLHIAVNRMNEQAMKVVDPHGGFDIEAAHKVLALVEHKQGWRSEKNARYAVNEQGMVVPRAKAGKSKPKQPALDFECATGEKSAQRIALERGHSIIQSAVSWAGLHSSLAAAGLRFERKGSGAIIFVGDTAVKASSVDRAFSLKKLEKRLGSFVPGNYPEEKVSIPPEPVSPINVKQWQQYRDEYDKEAPPVLPGLEENPEISQFKERHRKEQATLPARLGKQPLCILNIARHCLKLQQRAEMKRLQRKTKKPSGPRKQRFEDWLRDRGMNYKADRWRYREVLETLPLEFRDAPTVMATPKHEPLASYAAHKRAMLKAVPNAEPDRLISYATLQMRKEGFSQEVVEDTIFHCAPEDHLGHPERNWRRYAERMAACAFGIAGDVKLAQGSAAREKQWQAQKEQEKVTQDTPRSRMR